MDIFEKAVCFAVNAHCGMKRKNGETPYILHPLEAASIAATMSDDINVLAAAVLHDVLEDTDVNEKELRRNFGDHVTDLVLSESENKRHGSPEDQTWQIRKEESLEELAASDDIEIKIIWLADKLSNMRSFYRMFLKSGPDFWKKGFNQPDPEKQKWYYYKVLDLTQELKEHAAWQEYKRLTAQVFGQEEDPEGPAGFSSDEAAETEDQAADAAENAAV